MNNRQAGAHRESILKEQRAREAWMRNNMQLLERTGQLDAYASQGPPPSRGGRPASAAPGGRSTASRPQSASADNRFVEGSFVPDNYDPAIYDKALRISSPRLVDDEDEEVPRTVQRKVMRQVEIPFTRNVKVPVKTRKIIPVRVQKKVRTKKLVEVPSFKMVDETYTELVDEPAVRNKEIWVKKVVPERYMKKVPVTRVRQVKVPTTEIREVDDYEIVEVAGSKAVEVDGFRVDTVEDSKLMEVEEYQTFELRPHASGPARVAGNREVGNVRGQRHSRRVGQEVYHVQDERHRDVDLDSEAGDAGNRGNRPASASRNMRPQRPGSAPATRGRSNSRGQTAQGSRNAFGPQSGNYYQQQQQQPAQSQGSTGRVGLKLKQSNQNGVIVYKVNPGQAAERAGILTNDIISYVNNRPTRNLQEFREVVNNAAGPLSVQVRRSGGRKLLLTIVR